METSDIAALSIVARQAFAQQQASVAFLRMTMDGAQTQAQGIAEMMQAVDPQKLAEMTGVGQKLDITI